jgi:hypothetical protein
MFISQHRLLLLNRVLLAAPLFLPCSALPANDKFDAQARAHWAFQKVTSSELPPVQSARECRNPIDAFILAPLEAKQLTFSAPADKSALLRRASLDLVGLPPTPAEIEQFLADDSTDAFAKMVERLLSSAQYGERWARHWLDLARYAESDGFKSDETRPNAWRYRDYVIHSLNQDKPYDRFVREQIAGDELWPADPEALVATAFHRHYPDESNARNLRQRRQEILNDITDTVGAVFVGMTYACARCHDHKYEPILQTDYYRLQAFFANTAARDDIVLTSQEALKRYRARQADWEEKTRDLREELERIAAPHRLELEKDYFEKYPAEIQTIINKPESERNPFERQMAWKAKQYLDPHSREYVGDDEAVRGKLKGEAKKRWLELTAQLEKFDSVRPAPLPIGTGMGDLGCEAPATYVLAKGVFDKPQQEVQPGLLQILYPGAALALPSSQVKSTGRRTALANLLTDPQNPLTARVMVNRVWHYHFGKGLVGTPSDFGVKGEAPTHPALLDWLTSEFIGHGWSVKYLHRLIMTSRTYQQASAFREDAAAVDPENKLLWRFPRHRLEGEAIRDASLAVAGLLSLKMGGPSVFPELPEGMPPPRGGWKVDADANERHRRSIYVFVRRNTRYPMFDTFDMPDAHESCPRRNTTTSPLQALTLLNDRLSLQWAQSFAGRVIASAGEDVTQQIDAAYQLAYARQPDAAERQIARDFFESHRPILSQRASNGEGLALPPGLPRKADLLEAATLVDFCHMLMNANEFVYLN